MGRSTEVSTNLNYIHLFKWGEKGTGYFLGTWDGPLGCCVTDSGPSTQLSTLNPRPSGLNSRQALPPPGTIEAHASDPDAVSVLYGPGEPSVLSNRVDLGGVPPLQ